MSRLLKQFVIGGIYFVIVFGICWLLYRAVVPSQSCTDAVQNGEEEGVDCGALACGVLCPAPVLPLQIADTKILKAGSGYDVLVQLENPNPLYGASRVDYILMVQDAAGTELTVRRGFTYVNPAQPRYLLFPLTGIAGVPQKAELQFDAAQVEWSALTIDAKGDVQFAVRNDLLTPSSGSLRYEAAVLNRSKFTFDTVDIVVLLSDSRGTLVGANTTVQRTHGAGEERAFSMNWPFAVPGAASAQTIVTTNVFANENYIREYGSQERFQGF